MAFRLEDFKKTTRKAAGAGTPASVYPHQMRDKKALARLHVAIRTFDGLVGKRRGEMDAGAMTDFFGDPRLARGVVACLGQFYVYRTPRFAETVGADGAARLLAAEMGTPIALRAHTYAFVNTHHDGFLTEETRAACYEQLAAPYGLSARDWDALLHLDAEENQILTRTGPVPCPADLAALYNFHALDTVLRRATTIVLGGLSLTAAEASDARALARAFGVQAVVSGEGSVVTLSDVDMSSLLPRRPGRLGRVFLLLAQVHATRAATGYVDALLGARRFRLALGADALKALGALAQAVCGAFRRRLEMGDALHKGVLKLRAAGRAEGWRIKRFPEPAVTPLGVFLPDFALTQGERRVFVALGEAPAGDWGAPVLCLPLSRKDADPADVLACAQELTLSLFAAPARETPAAVPADVRALCDRAAASGLVRVGDAQRALHLLDESPLIEWVRMAADPRVRYIPGVGLCAQEVVAAIAQERHGEQMSLFPR